MELVQELFVTAFVAIVLSFLVAKLVSMVICGDVGCDSGKNVACDTVMEEVKFDRGGLRVESTESKRRVRFVEGVVKTVDQFEDHKSVQVQEKSEVLVFKERCESGEICAVVADRIGVEESLGEEAEVAGLSEKSPEGFKGVNDANTVTGIDGLVVEEMTDGTKAADELDGDKDDNIVSTGLDGLVVEEIIVQIAKSASDNVVADQRDEEVRVRVRDEERRENQRSGIEVEVSKVEVKEEELDCDDDVVADQGEERRENQRSGIEVEVRKGEEEKEELGCDDDVVADQNEEVRSEERGENQGSGIEVGMNKGEEEKEELDCDENIDDVFADQNEEIRVEERGENQGSGIEVGMNKGQEEKEELDCNEDDDWEGIERSELEKVFAVASNYVGDLGNNDRLENVGSDVQMQLYGLHKVAMEGPCHEPQPMALKVTARAKCDGGQCLRCARNAWQRLGNMSPEVAMEQYITLISDKVPGWMESDSAGDGKQDSSEEGIPGAPHSDMSKCLHNQLNPEEDSKLDIKCATGGGELAGFQT